MTLYHVQGVLERWVTIEIDGYLWPVKDEREDLGIDRRILAASEEDAVEMALADVFTNLYDGADWRSGPFVERLPETAKMLYLGAPMLPGWRWG